MKIDIQPTSVAPIYAQVRDYIENQIRTKTVSSGESLPAPPGLAKKLSVDPGEIQRAYYELEISGLVVKKKGKDLFGKEKITYLVK
jgi:GntR family transcriptional regulator